MYWNEIKRFFEKLETFPKIAFVFFGCGFARAWLWWALSTIYHSPTFPGIDAQTGHLIFDLGEVVGFLGLSFLAFKASPFYKRPSVLAMATVSMIMCSGLILVARGTDVPSSFAIAIVFLGGFGYALMLLLWLELFGCLTTKNMILAWTGSFFVGLLTWTLFEASQTDFYYYIMSLLPLMCCLMLLRGFWKLPEKVLPEKMRQRPVVPWKLAIVLSMFALAFGIGDVITGMNMFSSASRMGMALPELLVLVGVVFFSKRFTLRHLISAASLFIVAGLVFAFFFESSGIAPFVLLNMSSEIYLILSYTIACAIGHQTRSSAIFLCGLFAGLYKIFLQIGKATSLFLIDSVHADSLVLPLLGAVIILITVASSIALIQDQSLIEKISWKQQSDSLETIGYARIVEDHKLTPKESSVLLMLSQGLDSSEIAEELFLAPSTVRVHISSIYKKLDVHSRKELQNILHNNKVT